MDRVKEIVRVKTFLLACGLCLASGAICTFFSSRAIHVWYDKLHKVWFTPSDVIFGPVWAVIYVLMAFALYLFWIHKRVRGKVEGDAWFRAQLSLCTLWYVVFFGARDPKLAFILSIGLFLAVCATVYTFWRVRRISAVLLMPYLLWVGLAGILNFFIVLLNP